MLKIFKLADGKCEVFREDANGNSTVLGVFGSEIEARAFIDSNTSQVIPVVPIKPIKVSKKAKKNG